MLARQFRLPTTVSFQQAQVFHSPLFTVRVVPNAFSTNRYGFIAGKKIDKRSAVRNKIKRRVRSVIEKEGLSLKGKDVLFLLKPSLKDTSFDQIQLEVRGILQKLS